MGKIGDEQRIATVPTEQAVHDLLSDLRKEDGGWNPAGNLRRINGKTENGTIIITYTFDGINICEHVNKTSRLTEKQIAVVEQAMRDIEKVSNLKFRRAYHVVQEQTMGETDRRSWHVDQAEKADIRFLQGEISDGGITNTKGQLKSIILNDKINKIHFETNRVGYSIVLHEMLHALGLSHPGSNGAGGRAGGENPLYTEDTTLMSYNRGKNSAYALRPFDVATLQYLYGKPKGYKEPEPELKIEPVRFPTDRARITAELFKR